MSVGTAWSSNFCAAADSCTANLLISTNCEPSRGEEAMARAAVASEAKLIRNWFYIYSVCGKACLEYDIRAMERKVQAGSRKPGKKEDGDAKDDERRTNGTT